MNFNLPAPKSNHHLERYIKLVNYVLEHQLEHQNASGYTENHHILPKSMSGSNKPENIIKFTARQHFLAHWMLWKAYQNKTATRAFWLMRHTMNRVQNRNKKLSSVVYEKLRIEHSYRMSSKNHPLFGKKFSNATKNKMSQNHADFTGKNNPMYGKKRVHSETTKAKISCGNKGKLVTDETRKRMSIATSGTKNPNYGRHHSEETKRKISEARMRR